jgi:lipopolysaccharide/colanic/teichoic acid biosynthesis glycosyltransferase
MIRFFDILFSALGIIILFPLYIIIYLLVIFESEGGGFFLQNRVGKDGVDFVLYKFRSMRLGADKNGLITIGGRDPRLTRVGISLRGLKLDELPQLFNVLKGDMSLVGPRPEVRKYTDLYTAEQLEVLKVRPGLTDYASIEYADENMLLGGVSNPEKLYIEEIMPHKLQLNMKYIQNQSIKEYFKVIFLTVLLIFKR